MVAGHVRGGRGSDQLQREQDLVAEELEDVARAGFAVGRQAPQRRAAREDRFRAERQRLHDIRPAADAAVEQHRQPARDRLHHLRQRVDRRRHAVELPPAVVRDDDPRRAVLAREARVLARQHTLHEHRQARRRRRAARRRAR